ncbi:MAG: 30S ribosomal protein S17 [Pirellulaceae bacterium]|nr:30S ribosomal protein S17 [Pirellulaceae bacterium]
MPARILTGVVTGDKCAKTRRVEINRLVRHAKYGKYIRRRTVCHVHDENNESAVGELVEIQESRPLSRLKRWTLLRIVEKNKEVDVAALRIARRSQTGEELIQTLETLQGETDAPSAT